MYWYFASRCAGIFPWRHRFQTHHQYDEVSETTEIGEQPGLRLYSKGFGPIGSAHQGLTWQGKVEAFTNGVAVSAGPPSLLTCPPSLIGLYPFPPPSTWGSPEFQTTYSNDDWTLGPHGSNAGEYLHWYVLELGIDPLDPDSIITAEWHYVEGLGMVLYFGFSADTYSEYLRMNTTFIEVVETVGTVSYRYSFHDVFGGEYVMNVTLTKCIP